MDKLHGVLRNLQGERKSEAPKPPEHITVFREFIAHLDRMSRGVQRPPAAKTFRPAKRRATKR